jgi:hypothetical protein
VPDRWNRYLRRRADALANRADLADMRHGLLPDGWVYGLNDERQEVFDEQRRILLELHKGLYREPVSGPDEVAVAIWYEGTDGYRAPMIALNTQWPSAPRGWLTAVAGFFIRLLNRPFTTPQLIFVVQAHAMSGPPAVLVRRFPRKQDAAAFAARLAQRVRVSGVEALRRD